MTKLYKLQIFLGCDVGKSMGKMLVIDRFKINQEKFYNSLRTLGYHYNLIIFPNIAYEMLIKSS